MTVPPALGWSVLALVFVDELLVMAALGVWGADAGGWWLAAGAVVAGVLVWFLFASPKARYGGPVARPVAKVLVIGAGVAGLAAAGHPGWAVALAVYSVIVNGVACTLTSACCQHRWTAADPPCCPGRAGGE